jgi:hypothetical protein
MVISAPNGRDEALMAAIAQARQTGHVVIQALDEQDACDGRVTHRLMQQADGWQIVPVDAT